MENKKRPKRTKTCYAKVGCPQYRQIKEGSKTFLVVPDNLTYTYKVRDVLIIDEQKEASGMVPKDTGESLTRVIECVQRRGKGLQAGFVILGFKPPEGAA